MMRRAATLRLLLMLSALLLTASGCLANNDPFSSAAFPTPQASLFSSAGFQPRTLTSNDTGGEFTLVAFERMVLEGGNQSDINIDISRSPQPVEQYLFVIDRSRHSVTVLNADTQDISEDLGDVHVRLRLEVTDPVALAGYTVPDATVFRFAVQYVPGFVRIVDVMTQTDAVLELTNLTKGTQSTIIQTQLAGLRASLAVDVLDRERDDDEDRLEEDVGPVSREDKPQQPLNLGDSSVGGSVNVIVRLEEEAPPVAVLPPPTDDITQPNQDEPPPPDVNEQPQQDPSQPPPADDGQTNDNASGQATEENPDPPPDNPQEPSDDPQEPTDPDGDEPIPSSSGRDPNEPNVDIVFVIDDSSNMRTDDPLDERLEAVRAFLNAAIEGDNVGLVRFSDNTYQMRMTRIIQKGGTLTDGGIVRLRTALEVEPILTTGLTPSHLGLISACDELVENGRLANRMAILISDGVPNVGVQRGTEFFGPVEECFNVNGWPIYTVGIGNYDAANLDALADNTGGDARYVAKDEMTSLICNVQAIRANYAGGTALPCREDILFPSMDPIIFSVNVPSAQLRASFNLNWLGSESDVELRLVRPNGKVVAGRVIRPNDVSFDGGTKSGKTLETYGIDLPEAGTWRVQIIPRVVSPEGTMVVFGFSSVPAR